MSLPSNGPGDGVGGPGSPSECLWVKAGPLELSSSQLCPHGVGVACYPSSFGSRALCRLSRPRHLHSCWQTASLDGFSTLVGYFPGGSEGQESACSAGDVGSIPGSGRSPGEGHGNPLQYFSLENPHGPRSLAGSMGSQESDMTKHSIACYDCPLFPSVDTQK